MGAYLDKVLRLAAPDTTEPVLLDTHEPDEWDESDWDDVREHLINESPWFDRVLAGEAPDEPDEEPEIQMTPRTAEASTVPQPTGKPGGPGLFHVKGLQLPPYVQHLYKHLVARYGKHRAYGVAIGIVKKWAAGVNPGGKGKEHKVHADVQAAAGKNVAQWEKDKAKAHESKTTHVSDLDRVLALAGGAPAAWPSGKPYEESFLPKPGGGPGSGKTKLKQGYPTNTGVVTTSPGAQPIVYGHLRQAPSQTVSAGPPLPPGVSLPDPKEFEALAGKISDGPDRELAESARSHLKIAARKFRTGDRQGPLALLRIVQTDLHALYRKVVAENRPHEAQVFSEKGFAGSVPPAAQSSARAEMYANKDQMLEYRQQVTQVATWIDLFRRAYFHGQMQGVAEGRFAAGLIAGGVVALVASGNGAEASPAGPKKDQASVHYRDGREGRDCGTCTMVRIMPPDFESFTCTAVNGPIREDGTCDLFEKNSEADPHGEKGAMHKFSDDQQPDLFAPGEPAQDEDRYVTDALGHKHWGEHGAAGVLPIHVDDEHTIRYGLQRRAGKVQHSGTYSTVGGAIDQKDDGEIETPVEAAMREAGEEFGEGIPEGKILKVYTDQHGVAGEPGAWAYHTVHVQYPEQFQPSEEASHGFESGGIKWVAPEEMGKLPLHPDFRSYAEAHLGVQPDMSKQPDEPLAASASLELAQVRGYVREEAGRLEHVRPYEDTRPEWQRVMDEQKAKELAAGESNARGMARMMALHHAQSGWVHETTGLSIPHVADVGMSGRPEFDEAQQHLVAGRLPEAADALGRAQAAAEAQGAGRKDQLQKLARFRNQVQRAKVTEALPRLAKLGQTGPGEMTVIDHTGAEHQVLLKDGNVTVTSEHGTASAPAGSDPTTAARKLVAQLAKPARAESYLGQHVRVSSGYREGKTGHVSAITGSGVHIDTGDGHPLPIKHGFWKPDPSQPDRAPAPAPPSAWDPRTVKRGNRVVAGMREGRIIQTGRWAGIDSALVEFPVSVQENRFGGVGYASHWIPLDQLKLPKRA